MQLEKKATAKALKVNMTGRLEAPCNAPALADRDFPFPLRFGEWWIRRILRFSRSNTNQPACA
jgi:hypothetical protein